MRFYLGLIICLLLSPPAAAQIVLQKSADLPEHYIVEFKSSEDAAARLREQGSAAIEALRRRQAALVARLQDDLRDSNLELRRSLWLKQSVAIFVDAGYLERIRALPYVAAVRVEQQFRARPQGVVRLPISGELVQDNLERIDVDSMWNAQYRGQGVVVAILDSGVDMIHEDLVDRWRGGTNSWYDPYQQQPRPKDLIWATGTESTFAERAPETSFAATSSITWSPPCTCRPRSARTAVSEIRSLPRTWSGNARRRESSSS